MGPQKANCSQCSYEAHPDRVRKHRKIENHNPRNPGRPRKPPSKLSTLSGRSEATIPATDGSLNDSPGPAKGKTKANKLTYLRPKHIIWLDWTGYINPRDVGWLTKAAFFWEDAIEARCDPLWVYRYLSWRMGNPRNRHLMKKYGGPNLPACIHTTLEHIRREHIGDADELKIELKFYAERIDKYGTSFGGWPKYPAIGPWEPY